MESVRLQELLNVLTDAKIFDPVEQALVVRMGNTVLFWNSATESDQEISIGGYGETNQANSLVSYESPVAQSILGKTANDVAHLTIGAKEADLIIKKIYPPSFKYTHLLRELAYPSS